MTEDIQFLREMRNFNEEEEEQIKIFRSAVGNLINQSI